jgi:AhpD family alkylhydroperoxidase
MPARINFPKTAPEAYMAMRGLEAYLRQCGLEKSLLELVKTRASQLNGCAYCIDMHTKEARANGETEQRLFALSAWRETPFFSDRERAALAWTEAVTLVADGPIEQKSLVDLTLAIVAINGWNRLSIAFATVPGTYRPAVQEP